MKSKTININQMKIIQILNLAVVINHVDSFPINIGQSIDTLGYVLSCWGKTSVHLFP